MMTVFEAIAGRRSVRRFDTRPVPEEVITKLLDAARWAPSAGNLQPWFFYVVQDRPTLQQLALDAGGQPFVAQAPVSIVVCADPQVSASKYRTRGANLYCLQDTAAATQNIMLAAFEQGLGACWVGAFEEDKVHETLAMPPGRKPVAIIPIGYPTKVPNPTGRKELAQVCKWV